VRDERGRDPSDDTDWWLYSQTSYHIEMSNRAVKGRRQSRRNDPFRDRGPLTKSPCDTSSSSRSRLKPLGRRCEQVQADRQIGQLRRLGGGAGRRPGGF
jgi:hypothetical protein